MDSLFKDLRASFKEATSSVYNQSKERSVGKLIESTLKSLEKVLSVIDTFLKSKNIDVKQTVTKAKTFGKGLLGKGNKILDDVQDKGLLKTLKDSALKAKAAVSDAYSKYTEKDTGPPKEAEPQGWMDKLAARQNKRKAEVEAEKSSVKEAGKDKKSGWLSKILSGIMSVGGFLVKGFAKILGPIGTGIISATKFLGGFLLKGFGKALTSLVGPLSGSIAKGLSGLIGRGAGAVASVAGAGLKGAATAALPFLKTVGMAAGRAALTIAAGPIGWIAAAATVAYAGYKLYKYIKRNDVATDIYGKLTMLRLYTYGFSEANKEYFSKIFDLEMLMKDFYKYSDGKSSLIRLDNAVIEKVLDLFSVKREDKAAYQRLNTWFTKRFIPSYKAFMDALCSVNSNVYLDSLESLKPRDIQDFLDRYKLPTTVHDVKEIPVEGSPQSAVTKDQIDTILAGIIVMNKKNLPAQEPLPAAMKKESDRANAAKSAPPAPKPAPPPPTPKPAPVPRDQMGVNGAEGEPKPNVKASDGKVKVPSASKLNLAAGDLMPGGTALEGITSKVDKSKILSLDPNVRELFTGMAKEYNALTGKNIPVSEAFRTREDQMAIAAKYPDRAAKPGTSLHEFGLALDVAPETVKELDKMGLLRKYGFTTTVGGEPWHIEPIGVSLRPKEAVANEAFRYSAIMSSPGRGGGGFGLQAGSPLGRRNIQLQESIYNSNSGTPIDFDKIRQQQAQADAQAPKAPTDGAPKPTVQSKPTPTGGSPGVAYQESEVKPVSSTTKTPVTQKEAGVSLNAPPTAPGAESRGNLDIAKYAQLPVEQAIRQAAKMAGMDEKTMLDFAKLESSLNARSKAGTSSASGLFQITDATWKDLVSRYGKKYGLPDNPDRNNPFYNALMASEYAKENLAKLPDYKSAGIEESTALYMTHRFGTTGGRKFINQLLKNPSTPIQDAVSQDAFSANYNDLNGHTVGSYAAKIAGKFEVASKTSTAAYTGKASTSPSNASNASTAPTPTPTVSKTSVSAPAPSARPSVTKPAYSPSTLTEAVYGPSTPPKTATPTANPGQAMFSTTKVEAILTDQLSALADITNILQAINGKIDPERLTTLLAGNKTPSIPPVDKNIPTTVVDLSRKKLTT